MAAEIFDGELDKAPTVEPFSGELDSVKVEPFTGELDAGPTYLGALGTTLKQSLPKVLVSGQMAVGDVLAGSDEPLLQPMQTTGIVDATQQTIQNLYDSIPGKTALGKLGFGVSQIPANALMGTAQQISGATAPESVKETGREMQTQAMQTARYMKGEMQEETPKDLNMLQEASLSAVESAAMMAPWLVAGRFGAPRGVNPETLSTAALGTFGVTAFGETYAKARETVDAPQALGTALTDSFLEVATEKLGLDTLLKGGKGWFKKFLLQEIGGEELATIGQSLNEKSIYNPEKWNSADEVMHDLAVTALAAGMGAGMIKGVDKAVEPFTPEAKERSEIDQRLLEEKVEELRAQLLSRIQDPTGEGLTTLQAEGPLTDFEKAVASVQREQIVNGLDVPGTPEAQAFGKQLGETASVLQEQGITIPDERQDEGGITPEVAQRRAERYAPNSLPMNQRPITWSSDERMVGLTFDQIGEPAPGTLHVVGNFNEHFPAEVFTKVAEDLQSFMRKHLPQGRVILNLEQFAPELQGTTFGNHLLVNGPNGLTHVITPREMTAIGKHGVSDPKTSMAFMTSLSHEFGHAVTIEWHQQLLKDVFGGELAGVNMELKAGAVSPENLQRIAAVAPQEAALIQHWQDLRGKILRGELSAVEFMDQWVGTRKQGDSISKTKGENRSMYSWAEGHLGSRVEGRTALDLVQAAYGNVHEALSFEEFMAEQYSRHAYASGMLAKSKLGKYFAQTLERLRALFRDLKTMGAQAGSTSIGPSQQFADWLEDITLRAKSMKKPTGKQTGVSRKILAAQRKIAKEAGTPFPKEEKEAAPPPEQVPVPLDVKATQIAPKEVMEKALADMLFSGVLGEKSPRYVAIRGMLKRGQLAEAQAKIEDTLGENLHFDREYTSKLVQRLPDQDRIKITALRGLLQMQDITQKERNFWNQYIEFYGNVPNSDGKIAREDLLKSLQNIGEFEQLQAVDVTGEEEELDEYGYWALGVDPSRLNIRSTVWNSAYVAIPPRDLYQKYHWKSQPNYFSHTRSVDSGRGRLIVEIQNDLITRNPELVNSHPEIVDWLARTVEEEMHRAAEEGMQFLYFPTLETAARIQNWPSVKTYTELNGAMLHNYMTDTAEQTDGTLRWTASESEGTDGFVQARRLGTENDWFHVEIGEIPLEILGNMKEVALKHLQVRPLLLSQYTKSLPKILAKYGVEQTRAVKTSWLRVPVAAGVKIGRFDRENPYVPNVPAATLVDFAGATEGQAQDALASWKNLGTDSPFFKRWFGASMVQDIYGKPLGVYRSNGGEKTGLGARTFYWLTDNPLMSGVSARDKTDGAAPLTQRYFVRMENPLVVDRTGQETLPKDIRELVAQGLTKGHDGLILLGVTPLSGERWYVPFSGEQLAMDTDLSNRPVQDLFHWDQEQSQQTVKGIVGMLGKWWTRGRVQAANATAKAMDYSMQLQQMAASQPEDGPLQAFMGMIRSSLMMKNRLQYPAEETTKALLNASPETVKILQKVLTAEWKGGELQGLLIGVDATGQEASERKLVTDWRVHDGAKLRAFLAKHGVDATTEQGKQVLALYLKVRNTFQVQFKGLEIALKDKALRLYENTPLLLKQELYKVEELMTLLRASPFLPQGRFGNYVLIVQKDQGPQGVGKRRFLTVRRQHFESKAEFDEAYLEWQQKARGDNTIRVKSQVLEDTTGALPMQLPREFLEKVAETGDFTDAQIEMLSELMTRAKYDKLEARYAKLAEKTEGANEDFIRVFSAFALNNSNFVWKTYYRTALNGAIAEERAEVRLLERGKDRAPADQLAAIERKRRNILMMERAVRYIMHPPQEFHNARLWLTMLYLAYNVKTAVMNVSTMLNTWAAVTSEYGEINGEVHFAKGLVDAKDWLRVGSLLEKGKATPWQQEIAWLKAKAEAEGVVDQSYAYFLAGQADSGGMLGAVHTGKIGRATHTLMELGMYPFRAVEKMNRVATLSIFYRAERGKGAEMEAAYNLAVQKTNLLQNAYDQANKPELLRGKKSILMMFASYTQFMMWITSGGYERAARSQASALGRTPGSVWHGTTMKIWLLYLALAGMMGVPYGENLLELAKWIWRRVLKQPEDLEVELRKLVEELGMDANLAMHGLLHNAGGFDLSGSFGLGRLIPGVDLLNRDWRNPQEALGNGVLGFSGPAGGAYKNLTAALAEFGSGEWREGLKKMPGEIGALTKAIDAYLLQTDSPTYGVTAKNGERLTYDLQTGEFRDLTTKELMGMALGANPTILAENREMRGMVQGETIYWMTRRSDMMDKYWKTVRTQDEAGRELIRDEIDKFNQGVPDPKLRITGKDLAQSIRTRKKAVQVGESFGTGAKRMRGEAEEIRSTFREGGE